MLFSVYFYRWQSSFFPLKLCCLLMIVLVRSLLYHLLGKIWITKLILVQCKLFNSIFLAKIRRIVLLLYLTISLWNSGSQNLGSGSLCTFFLFFWPQLMWDLSSQTRDWTQATVLKNYWLLTTRPPGNFPTLHF